MKTLVNCFFLIFFIVFFGHMRAQPPASEDAAKVEAYLNQHVPHLVYHAHDQHIGKAKGGDLFLRLKIFRNGAITTSENETDTEWVWTNTIPLVAPKADGRIAWEKVHDLLVGSTTQKERWGFKTDIRLDLVVVTTLSEDPDGKILSRSQLHVVWHDSPCVVADLGLFSITHCVKDDAEAAFGKSLQPYLLDLDRRIERELSNPFH